jgi:DNA mismatch repair protein MutS2
VARRCGLPEAVVERARQNLSAETGPLGAALAALEAERGRLAKVRAELESERTSAAERRQQLDAQAEALSRRQAEVDAGARRELIVELDRVKEQVRGIVAELQRAPDMATAAEARDAVTRAIGAQERALASPRPEPATAAIARLVAGQRVRSRSLAKDGDLLSVEGETGMVAFGAIKLRQPLGDLSTAESKRPAPPSDRHEKLRRAERAAGGGLDAPSSRCDLRGLRAEEAVREAERFLDHAFSDGASEVLLLHGLGSGALKASLRTFLARSSYVRSFHAAEAHQGGEGTTVVELGDG